MNTSLLITDKKGGLLSPFFLVLVLALILGTSAVCQQTIVYYRPLSGALAFRADYFLQNRSSVFGQLGHQQEFDKNGLYSGSFSLGADLRFGKGWYVTPVIGTYLTGFTGQPSATATSFYQVDFGLGHMGKLGKVVEFYLEAGLGYQNQLVTASRYSGVGNGRLLAGFAYPFRLGEIGILRPSIGLSVANNIYQSELMITKSGPLELVTRTLALGYSPNDRFILTAFYNWGSQYLTQSTSPRTDVVFNNHVVGLKCRLWFYQADRVDKILKIY